MTDAVSLFAYGSLRPGMPLWSTWLEPVLVDYTDNVWTRGRLWMTKAGAYPWMTEGMNRVMGTLVKVERGERLELLTEMEIGAGYRLTPVEWSRGWPDGGLAYTFIYPRVHPDFILVPGQDWSAWCNNPDSAIGTEGWRE